MPSCVFLHGWAEVMLLPDSHWGTACSIKAESKGIWCLLPPQEHQRDSSSEKDVL